MTEEPTDDINGSVSGTEKNFSIEFSKARTNFLKFKVNKKKKNPFLFNFVEDLYPKNVKSKQVSFKANVYVFFQSIMTLLINLKF